MLCFKQSIRKDNRSESLETNGKDNGRRTCFCQVKSNPVVNWNLICVKHRYSAVNWRGTLRIASPILSIIDHIWNQSRQLFPRPNHRPYQPSITGINRTFFGQQAAVVLSFKWIASNLRSGILLSSYFFTQFDHQEKFETFCYKFIDKTKRCHITLHRSIAGAKMPNKLPSLYFIKDCN